MKLSILLVSLFLFGCAASVTKEKSEELYQIALDCNEREKVPVIENGVVQTKDGKVIMRPPKGACADEWTAWNEMDEKLAQRAKNRVLRKGPKCPPGEVAYCDDWCMRSRLGEKQWSCVNEHIMRDSARIITRY